MTKAKELLNWEPKVDLESGIRNCEPWLREHGLLK
jgi:nucleoside-diphosphate-sugar epimerase